MRFSRIIKSTLSGILFVYALSVQAQVKRVLFLGNSYTYVNNLPQITKDFAASAGDSMAFDNNTPGGYTLEAHSTNSTSINKIAQGNWDVVVLQEQSQRPSFPISQVVADVFPYARHLDSLIDISNSCAETMFYMTWGRKNGDASNCVAWPPVCTYQGMDSLLHLRYMMMADSNNAGVSPVGAVWKYLRKNYPAIILYQADESHPSAAGSYAAACSFYTAIFRKDPSLSSYNYNLPSGDAYIIRNAAKLIVYDSLLKWNLKDTYLSAKFSYNLISGHKYQFTNQSQNAKGQLWDFGSGFTDTSANPTHTYPGIGKYIVQLMSFSDCDTAYFEQEINITLTGIVQNLNGDQLEIIPNPAGNSIRLNLNHDFPLPISIVNSRGEIMLNLLYSSGTGIDISSFAPGIYFIRSNKEDNNQVVKFVKK